MVPLILHQYSITKPGKLKYDFMSHTNKIRNIVSKTRKAILRSTEYTYLVSLYDTEVLMVPIHPNNDVIMLGSLKHDYVTH